MAISFPDFREPGLVQLLICGVIDSAHTEGVGDWTDKQIRHIAEYTAFGGVRAFAKLLINWIDEDGNPGNRRDLHVHLDCATEAFFDDIPTPTSNLADIQRLVAPLVGKPLDAFIDSRHQVPRKGIGKHGLVHPLLSFATRIKGMDVVLSGGCFDVFSDDDTLRLRWQEATRDSRPVILADIEGHVTESFDAEIFARIQGRVRPPVEAIVGLKKSLRQPKRKLLNDE